MIMKQGDYTMLAQDYIYRPGYSLKLLTQLMQYISVDSENSLVADVGAGTGKLTENLIELGLKGYAIEPNDAMRMEAVKLLGNKKGFKFLKGFAENTGLADNSINWVIMASSFHWTDKENTLKEFYRILKPGGFFTAMWNPRNIGKSSLHMKIENKIHDISPEIKRVSSGLDKYTNWVENILESSLLFSNLVFMEDEYEIKMEKERYLGAWRSVNDIRAQAGEEKFNQIMNAIEEEITMLNMIVVPYKTRAWTVKSRKI